MKKLAKRKVLAVFLTFAIAVLLIAPVPMPTMATEAVGEQITEETIVETTTGNGEDINFLPPAEPMSLNSDNLVISNANPTVNGGWLELTNPTSTAISTRGMYLSVNAPCAWEECNNCTADRSCNWQMPGVIIRPNQTVRVRASSNSTCLVLKRMTTNFDLAFGQTLRLVDARGEVVSEFGIVDPNAQAFDFFATGEMRHLAGNVWAYIPPQPVTFTIPTDQNITSVRIFFWDVSEERAFFPGETISVGVEGQGREATIEFSQPPR